MSNLIIVISAPSGTGKTTICKNLLKCRDSLRRVVSVTSRAPRNDECNGKDYFFVDEAEFERLRDSGDLFEWVKIYNNYYGISKSQLEALINAKVDVLCTVNEQGAKKLKETYKENAILIYLLPPSLAELRRRLQQRHENKTQIELRISEIKNNSNLIKEYDYLIINWDIETTTNQILKIIEVEQLRFERKKDTLEAFIKEVNTEIRNVR